MTASKGENEVCIRLTLIASNPSSTHHPKTYPDSKDTTEQQCEHLPILIMELHRVEGNTMVCDNSVYTVLPVCQHHLCLEPHGKRDVKQISRSQQPQQ